MVPIAGSGFLYETSEPEPPEPVPFPGAGAGAGAAEIVYPEPELEPERKYFPEARSRPKMSRLRIHAQRDSFDCTYTCHMNGYFD